MKKKRHETASLGESSFLQELKGEKMKNDFSQPLKRRKLFKKLSY